MPWFFFVSFWHKGVFHISQSWFFLKGVLSISFFFFFFCLDFGTVICDEYRLCGYGSYKRRKKVTDRYDVYTGFYINSKYVQI